MNHFAIVTLCALASTAPAQEVIQWSKPVAGSLPKAAAQDTRPTIVYFTFDT